MKGERLLARIFTEAAEESLPRRVTKIELKNLLDNVNHLEPHVAVYKIGEVTGRLWQPGDFDRLCVSLAATIEDSDLDVFLKKKVDMVHSRFKRGFRTQASLELEKKFSPFKY